MTANFHALLVGINCYLQPNMGYAPLGGCIRDADSIGNYLTTALKVPPEQITRLTATTGKNFTPVEPAGQLPSYENMVAQLTALARRVKSGDQVLFYYSGHGGRTKTSFPELKGMVPLDEALVPYDIGNTAARYLRDVELVALLKAIVATGAVLTVILDSCHSGGATRGQLAGVSAAAPRGMTPGKENIDGLPYDPTDRPTESAVGTHEELVAAWGPVGAGATARDLQPASGWLPPVQGFTLIAGCRANESAMEDFFPDPVTGGKTRHGALTYHLLRSLPALPPRANYQVLHNILLANIRTGYPAQTPQLQGEADRIVFGAERSTAAFGILVTGVNLPKKTVSLNAGAAHGLTPGARLAVYPNGAPDLASVEGRQALVKVTELVGDAGSSAQIVADYAQGALEPGAQAVLVGIADPLLQRAVALGLNPPLDQAVKDALAADDSGFLRRVDVGEPAHFQVGMVDGCYEIWDAAGIPIPNLRPPIAPADADAAGRLVKRLVHLAKYFNVRDLRNPDKTVNDRLKVELIGGPAVEDGHTPDFLPGVEVTLRITNRLESKKVRGNETNILNVTVLQLAA